MSSLAFLSGVDQSVGFSIPAPSRAASARARPASGIATSGAGAPGAAAPDTGAVATCGEAAWGARAVATCGEAESGARAAVPCGQPGGGADALCGQAASRSAAAGSCAAAALVAEFWQRMASNDFESVGALLADDFVLDWPQSGERFRGAGRFVSLNREYPAHGPWRFRVHRVVGGGACEAVSDVAVSDGVQQARVVSFFDCDTAAGRVRRIVEFWPEPYAAPAWRAHLSESWDEEEGGAED